MFSREKCERAVEPYFTTSMSTKQVVEHLGDPTRQCLERWLRANPRYTDDVPKSPIPLETRRRAVERCLFGMQQKQAAAELGVSTSAVHHWMRPYRAGGIAALEPKRRDDMPQAGTDSEPLGDNPDELRLPNREKSMPVNQLRSRYSLKSMVSLPRIAPSSYHYRHTRKGSISTGPCTAESRTCSANRGADTSIGGSRRR